MQLPQERQAGRGLPFEQHHNKRKIGRLHPLVERLIVFEYLPIAEAPLADQQNESRCIGDFLGKLGRPETARRQVCGCKENTRRRVLALDRGLEAAPPAPDPAR